MTGEPGIFSNFDILAFSLLDDRYDLLLMDRSAGSPGLLPELGTERMLYDSKPGTMPEKAAKYDIAAFSRNRIAEGGAVAENAAAFAAPRSAAACDVSENAYRLMDQYSGYYSGTGRVSDPEFRATILCDSVRTDSELVIRCLDIHSLCLQKKCVRRLRDYWWSSYQTYRGNFEWNFINVAPILSELDSDAEGSRLAFQKLQKRFAQGKDVGKLLEDAFRKRAGVQSRISVRLPRLAQQSRPEAK